jgi:hypothetical protein
MSAISGPKSFAGQVRPIKASRASPASFDLRISLMTSSILATAIARPTKICARSRDLFNRNLVRRVTTSSRNAMNACNRSLRFSCSGRPPVKAMLFTLKVLCNCEKR